MASCAAAAVAASSALTSALLSYGAAGDHTGSKRTTMRNLTLSGINTTKRCATSSTSNSTRQTMMRTRHKHAPGATRSEHGERARGTGTRKHAASYTDITSTGGRLVGRRNAPCLEHQGRLARRLACRWLVPCYLQASSRRPAQEAGGGSGDAELLGVALMMGRFVRGTAPGKPSRKDVAQMPSHLRRDGCVKSDAGDARQAGS